MRCFLRIWFDQVWLRQVRVLKLRDETIMQRLFDSATVRPFLGEVLGPLAVTVRTHDLARLASAIAELGLLTEVDE